jgi:DNA-binding NtrC family response regulator
MHPTNKPMGNPFESHSRVFVVDDEISIAKMLSVILQIHLFDATPFADPLAALEMARVSPPDYLISDIAMEGMTGIELARTFRREVPGCKILLFSALAEGPELVRRAQEEGTTFSFLQKPVHPAELVTVLRNL